MKLKIQSQIKVSRHLSTNFKKALNELYLRLSAQLKVTPRRQAHVRPISLGSIKEWFK